MQLELPGASLPGLNAHRYGCGIQKIADKTRKERCSPLVRIAFAHVSYSQNRDVFLLSLHVWFLCPDFGHYVFRSIEIDPKWQSGQRNTQQFASHIVSVCMHALTLLKKVRAVCS